MRNYIALFFAFIAFYLYFNQCANGQSLFSNFKDITPLAVGVENAIIADIDNDNDQDVLFSGRDYLAWFANNGNGNFGHNRTIIDSTKTLLEAKDYDNDGDVDILASSEFINSIFYIYENNGFGVFEKNQILNMPGPSYWYILNVKNLDNDGFIDIVVATENASYIYEGEIGQMFSPIDTVPNGARHVVDVDNDGDNDIISLYNVYRNNGAGVFTIDNTSNVVPSSDALVHFADMDNDGDIDVIGYTGSQLNIKSNNGNATFSVQSSIPIPYTSPLLNSVKTVDIDGDNDLDIVLTFTFNDNDVIYYKNNGGNNFSSTAYIVAESVNGLLKADGGDLDSDGDNDILYVTNSQSKIIWKKNNGTGTLGTERYITQAIKTIYDIDAVDIDFDQDLDILVASSSENKVLAYINDGTGNGFTEQQVFANIHNAWNLSSADFNNDGHKDVVVGYYDDYPEGKLAFILSNANNGYNAPIVMNMNADYPRSLITTDLDKDGKVDVLAVSSDSRIILYKNQTNSFTKHVLASGYYDVKLEAIDIDNDQDLDIVVYKEQIDWLENENNNFSNVHNILTVNSNYYADIALFDENNDGYVDITIKPSNNQTITWHNDGLGNFVPNGEISSQTGRNFTAADFDNDGDVDCVKVPSFPYSTSIEYEETEGNVAISYNLWTDIRTNQIKKFDLDNDGDLDLVAYRTYGVNYYYDGIYWSENLSTNPTLSGIVYYDTNQNGQYDAADYPLNNQNVALNPSAVVSYTNNNGYSYVLNQGAQSVAVNLGNDWHTTTPNPVNFTLASSQDTTINFGIYPNTLITQIKPYLTSNINRCSQTVPYYLTVVNEGTSVEPLSIVILNPDTLLNYVSASPAPDSVGTNGKLYWHINNLLPSQQQTFTIFFQIPNFNSMGDILSTNADVFSYNNANTQTNHNGFGYRPIVVCSYDPNDKSVTPAGEQNEHYTLMNEELFYTIRFQNTGNDTAFNIVIRDTLSANLNQNTFRPITSSHPMQVFRNSNGVVEFRFDNILLPDSTTNEPASHGFVQYAVKPQSGLSNATAINNTADIYFDANPPIVTNTTHNLMVYQIPCNIPTPINITGNNNVCNGYTEVYNVPYVLGATYNWSVERGTIISGNGTNQVTILWQDPSVGGIITVHVIKY